MTDPQVGLGTDADAHAEHTQEALTLLGEHVPLTLLLDLAVTIDSGDIFKAEPGSAEWLQAPGA
ncbi:MAG TPA: hypothetical protein VHW92_09990 [Mycobacteriales bacterium]|jgi:hypothetical protein|nr:hypothetical protein [Mycobacteriales bacterium]